MPPLNSMWVFTQDFPLTNEIIKRYQNDVFEESFGLTNLHVWIAEVGNPQFGDKWPPEWHKMRDAEITELNAVIPAGTVVSFNRYHASNSGDVQMTLQFYRSPDLRLTPKKRGGTGRGPMRFYLNLAEFNSLGDMEPFDEENP